VNRGVAGVDGDIESHTSAHEVVGRWHYKRKMAVEAAAAGRVDSAGIGSECSRCWAFRRWGLERDGGR
jgi:hypothetical protein